MRTINMLSSADKVKGQGVGSAYLEQVSLVKNGLDNDYEVVVNQKGNSEIAHYHTIDLKHYFHSLFGSKHRANVGYVHFLPETVDGSLKLPVGAKDIFYKYIISFYKKMDYLVTVNPYFIERLAAYGIDKSKIFYIPNFVSEEQFYPMKQEEVNAIRRRYEIDENSFVVLGVGQVQTRKGVLDFIEIAEKMPDVQFVWAGGFSFGKITDGYEELKKVVDNPPENVKFIGIVDREDMNSIYNMSDLLFMPSYNELFPMSILETMNCAKPMLLRDIDIYKDILRDYYLRGKDNGEFIKIIESIKAKDEAYETARELSKKGARFYSRDHVLKQWQEFYDKVYEEKVVRGNEE
ncbi:MAG: glycosyltransferase family 4 protein [Tissierellales bacterium]|nr:glycosyltransferase family 4 protein [Tissierellales bacterium]